MFSSPKKPSRIGAWDGRRRSSRNEGLVLPNLFQRPVLLRLGAVLLTALTVTVIAYHCGPTESYRVGQSVPHDLRARAYFDVASWFRCPAWPPTSLKYFVASPSRSDGWQSGVQE